MSRQELTELRNDQLRFKEFTQSAFNALDINGDGFINMDELTNFLEQAAGDFGLSSQETSLEAVMNFINKSSPGHMINVDDFSQFLDLVLEKIIEEGDLEDEEDEKRS